jgi:hypothetical protein
MFAVEQAPVPLHAWSIGVGPSGITSRSATRDAFEGSPRSSWRGVLKRRIAATGRDLREEIVAAVREEIIANLQSEQ